MCAEGIGIALSPLPVALCVCDLLTGLLEDEGAEVEEVGVGGVEGLAGAPHVLAVRPVDGVRAAGLGLADVVGGDNQEGGASGTCRSSSRRRRG